MSLVGGSRLVLLDEPSAGEKRRGEGLNGLGRRGLPLEEDEEGRGRAVEGVVGGQPLGGGEAKRRLRKGGSGEVAYGSGCDDR
jgi:hypothetical protein